MSMPIYEYRCDACERRFELLTSFAERDRAHACPSCESTRTRVLVSTFAAIGGDSEFTSTLPMAPTPRAGGGCCGGSCGCSHN
jgi:putative FmdB family regulatory protein